MNRLQKEITNAVATVNANFIASPVNGSQSLAKLSFITFINGNENHIQSLVSVDLRDVTIQNYLLLTRPPETLQRSLHGLC
jgi:hypothetical protein